MISKKNLKILIPSVVAVAILVVSIVLIFVLPRSSSAVSSVQTSVPTFGFQALKINGEFVSADIFNDERNKFAMKWERNADMLRKSDEERTDMILDEVIQRVIIEDYIHNKANITVTSGDVENYINKYIKTNFPTKEEMDEYLSQSGYANEDALKKGIETYLLRLKYFTKVAKEYGVTVAGKELEEKYQEHKEISKEYAHPKDEFADMLLMQKFGESDKYKDWFAKAKSQYSIEILDIAMKAYRLYNDKKYKEAGQYYEKAYAVYKNETYLQRASESYNQGQDWENVIKVNRLGMKMFPKKVVYYLNTAEGLYKSNQTKEALRLMKKSEELAKNNIVYRDYVVQAYTKLGLEKDAERAKQIPVDTKWNPDLIPAP